MIKYLHTINGKPAMFDGNQICYANYYGKANKMADSLQQIRREQELTEKYRNENGFNDFVRHEYSHLRFEC